MKGCGLRADCRVLERVGPYSPRMIEMALIAAGVALGVAGLAGILHLIPRMGGAGRALGGWLCRAPGLDLVISLFTWIPPTTLGIIFGWRGLVASIAGQIVGMLIWMFAHELANREHLRGPRIVTFLNRTVGRLNNHIALWVTVLSLPIFILIRVGEIVAYPPLTWLVGLPRYRTADWVNVSRQKFNGLVGHDLIWCLYCDWMTGVYSLGAEMLRNVESFWCPIRFASGKKCDNCKLDFPDISGGWAPADGTMGDVVATMEKHYGPDGTAAVAPQGKTHPWFGHPARLTVKGAPVDKTPSGESGG